MLRRVALLEVSAAVCFQRWESSGGFWHVWCCLKLWGFRPFLERWDNPRGSGSLTWAVGLVGRRRWLFPVGRILRRRGA